MDVFLLGAGRPAYGDKPSALKHITLNTRAMDWQIHSFESVTSREFIHYLGGYHVEEVINGYPDLNFTVIPDWEKRSVLHTLLRAPFRDVPVFAAYSDTVFRKESVSAMAAVTADVVYCIDSEWKVRYASRSPADINLAETIVINSVEKQGEEVEFTGLMYFSQAAAKAMSTLDESLVGTTLLDLLNYLSVSGFTTCPYDVAGNWAEFNDPGDIAHFILGTKADTLSRLETIVSKSHIGKQVCFTSQHWSSKPGQVLDEIIDKFAGENLIVRSSSQGEDNWYSSNAGGFESLLDVNGKSTDEISLAITQVINSYGDDHKGDDQILVQEFLNSVRCSGVIFTCGLESGAPYYRFNFDDKSQSTESVTAGTHGDLRTVILSRFSTDTLASIEPNLVPVLEAVQELELLLGFDKLDIEFAVDTNGIVHIFQVRPITVDHSQFEVDNLHTQESLESSRQLFEAHASPAPWIYGSQALFANMPDWNPAEIIGTRPKPLAFSLYRELITNNVWAAQRAEYGYRDVRPCTLIYAFSGQPYVDVRASLNSFIPSALPENLAEKLAEAYCSLLLENPQLHDKIEFDIAFTVWTPGFFDDAKHRLASYGLLDSELRQLESALKGITRQSLLRLKGDTNSINELQQRRVAIVQSDLAKIDQVFSLLNDCKRLGTLAFAHAARAGFVATTLLKSMVNKKIISATRYQFFLRSFNTVAGEIEQDKYAYSQGLFTGADLGAKYGHLRPGTYEITARAYWEDPERYLIPDTVSTPVQPVEFALSPEESEQIQTFLIELESEVSPEQLMIFLAEAIQAREAVKFDFTRNLSKALDLIVDWGSEQNITREDLSFLEYGDIEQLKINMLNSHQLVMLIENRKQAYAVTNSIELPTLLTETNDIYCFERINSQPNFVTANRVESRVICLSDQQEQNIHGAIILIPQADPGYDWLFSQQIGGLITQYGGANSHMAIRSAEAGLPAAIGVGEKLYEKISRMNNLELDCASQIIREIT
jgi:hypothetical protein